MNTELILLFVIIAVAIVAGFIYYQYFYKPGKQIVPENKTRSSPKNQSAFLTVEISLADTKQPVVVQVLINDKNMVEYTGQLVLKPGDKFSVVPGQIIYNDSNFITNISGNCEGVAEAGEKYICYVSTHRAEGAGLHE